MKKLVMFLLVVFVIVGGAAALVIYGADSAIKEAVTHYGSKTLGTQVSLDDASISFKEGTAEMKGLRVRNPEGYQTDYAFELGGVRVVLNVQSILSDKIIIEEVRITAPEITYEISEDGSNLSKLQKNAQSGSTGGKGDSEDASSAEDKGSEKKLVIKELYIENAKVTAATGITGEMIRKEATIPMIHLSDIGEKSDGATVAEVLDIVLDEIATQSMKAHEGSLDRLLRGTSEALDGAVEGVKGLFE